MGTAVIQIAYSKHVAITKYNLEKDVMMATLLTGMAVTQHV